MIWSIALSALLVASSTTIAHSASDAAQEAFAHAASLGLISTNDPADGDEGRAVLTIMPGNNNVQQSNFEWRSFQLENQGGKRIAAAFIDVTESIFSDVVFDADGSGGDDVAKELNFDWGTTETNPVSINGYQWKWLPARSESASFSDAFDATDLTNVNNLFVDELSDSDIGSASGGFRAELLLFDTFVPGETAEFSGDMDPNSLAGLKKGTVDQDSGWDVGGVSGAELINSEITILFGDGSTATGTIAADGSQAGSIAVIESGLPEAPGLAVTGTYEAASTPSVVVSANPGDTVRVSMVQAFDPVVSSAELANGKISADLLVQARLQAQYPTFPVSNAKLWQHVDISVPSSGSMDISDMLNYGTDTAIAYTAVVIDNDGIPLSQSTEPIRLMFSGSAPSCPTGLKADGSGYCVRDWCDEDYQCPMNSERKADRQCYDTVNDCECTPGFVRDGHSCVDQTCPNGKKPDAQGSCVELWCNDSINCPANSERKPNRMCYDTVNDCQCLSGFVKDGSTCVEQACPSGKKLDGSGYCVALWCNYNYDCGSKQRKQGRQCYDTKNDCE